MTTEGIDMNTRIKKLIDENRQQELQNLLVTVPTSEIVEMIDDLEDEVTGKIFRMLPADARVKAFEFMDTSMQNRVINTLPNQQRAQLLNEMSPDDRTAFLEDLPGEALKELLKLLSAEERTITLSLLGYPEDSVGRLMTPDYIAVEPEWTIQQVLDHVRENGKDSETINVIYVLDKNGILIDSIRIKKFLLVPVYYKVSQIVDSKKMVALSPYDDEEVAIGAFKKNNRVALPVIDSYGVMLGIVTIDDVLRLAEDEDTEDIQKIGGVEALEEPYMNIPFFKLMRKRAVWLILLFIGEMLTATAMGFFEGEIQKAVVLALFVPLIISSGGNSGSQASTLIIRAMALGEVTLQDWWKIMKREIYSGLFLGSLLGTIGFIRVAAWSAFTDVYGPHWVPVGITLFISLAGVVLWGTLAGSMLPLVLKRFGADPATSSAPFVATLVDVTGLLLYFSVAMLLLKGTML
jgi:magnesium transporter